MLQEKYKKQVLPEMMKSHGYKNVMAVPRIEKVVINSGFGRLATSLTKDNLKRFQDAVLTDMTNIAGQKAVLTKAHKSISSFKIRSGLVIGAKTTLRGKKMYDFLERFVFIALPRTRDFKGIDADTIDSTGNLSVGIKEHSVFPEIVQDKEKTIFGLQVIIHTTAKNKQEALNLLTLMGFPFKK